jgi:hypothetical protein
MKGKGELHDPEIGRKMPTISRNDVHDPLSDFGRESI